MTREQAEALIKRLETRAYSKWWTQAASTWRPFWRQRCYGRCDGLYAAAEMIRDELEGRTPVDD